MKSAHREQAEEDRHEKPMTNGLSIYKITAQRRRDAQELTAPKFINDANGNLLTKDSEICNMWNEYGEQFLNE